MLLFIQSVIILICLSILSVYITKVKIRITKRRKKNAASYCEESEDHKGVPKDYPWGVVHHFSEYVHKYIGHA